MFEQEEDSTQAGYWPSATDLFMTLFIIAIAILAVIFFALLPKNNVASQKKVIVAVGVDMGNVRKPVNALRKALELSPIGATKGPDQVVKALGETSEVAIHEIAALQKEIETLNAKIESLRREMGGLDGKGIADVIRERDEAQKQLHDKPPIIRIDEQREEYRFTSGSSEIGPEFAKGLEGDEFDRLAKEIIARQEEGRVKVDTLEIIGHTDGVPLSGGGNLDLKLPALLAGDNDTFRSLSAGSNNDLGLLRALAVKQQWYQFTSSHVGKTVLEAVAVRCYSAGQTILPEPTVNPDQASFRRDDPRARRIEMRLTRLRK